LIPQISGVDFWNKIDTLVPGFRFSIEGKRAWFEMAGYRWPELDSAFRITAIISKIMANHLHFECKTTSFNHKTI
jgi:hypothetical protein